MKPAIGILDANLMFLKIPEGRGTESTKEGARAGHGDIDRDTQYTLQGNDSLPLTGSNEMDSTGGMDASRFQDFQYMTQTDTPEMLNQDWLGHFASSVDF